MFFLRTYLLACRPKTWSASLCPVVMSAALALSDGAFDILLFPFIVLTALGIQITTNFANDYFDFVKGADTIERKGPLRVVQAGLISVQAMQRAIVTLLLLTFLCSLPLLYRGGFAIAFLVLLSLALAILYTAGPYPIAYLGLGEFFVLLFYGPIAVGGAHYLLTDHFSWTACLAGCSLGFFSSAILIANNLRDIETDRQAAKKTIPVRLGKKFGKIEYLLALLGALLPIFPCCAKHPFLLLALLIVFPLFPLVRSLLKEKQDPQLLNQVFVGTAKLLWLYTFLFCIGWML